MDILTEDEVVDALMVFLREEGWEIEGRCTAQQRGEDLVAVRNGQRLVIEAKGAGSSKAHTNRFGLEFTAGQVFDHVAKAVIKALRVVAAHESRAAIALPGNPPHRKEVTLIQESLKQLGIDVFLVSQDKVVRRFRPSPVVRPA